MKPLYTPYRWDPGGRKWIRVVTQVARHCGQESQYQLQLSTGSFQHQRVRVDEVRVKVALETWKECFKLRCRNKLPNIDHCGNQLYSMPDQI